MLPEYDTVADTLVAHHQPRTLTILILSSAPAR
jgi:hypothetical protein